MKKNFRMLSLLGIAASLSIIPKVSALSQSDFDQFLDDGKLVVNSVKPTKEYFWILNDKLSSYTYEKSNKKFTLTFLDTSFVDYPQYDCNSDFSKCTIVLHDGEDYNVSVSRQVDVVYSYDNKINDMVKSYVKKIPSNGKTFTLKDIEAIRYFEANEKFVPKNEYDELIPIQFSSEYRSFIDNKNFVFEPRMGSFSPYAILWGGTANFEYDNTIYGYADGIKVLVQKVLYVNDSESDIQKALQERLEKYIPGIKVTKSITKNQVIQNEINEEKEAFNTCKQQLSQLVMPTYPTQEAGESAEDYNIRVQQYRVDIENYYNKRNNLEVNGHYCGSYEMYENVNQLVSDLELQFENEISEEGLLSFYNDAVDDLYTVELPSGLKMDFFVIKDSTKVYSDPIEYVTSDVKTNVTISVDSSLIPLDTLIKVKELTGGEDYDKIVKILNDSNVEMFDLKLFSKSVDKYITKLEDGSFEVKIPLKDEFLDKDLIVYYVDEDGNTEAYEVTVDKENKVAIFYTKHFSIYTLVEKPKENSEKNPDTGDNITKSFMLLFLSGSTLTIISLRRKENN